MVFPLNFPRCVSSLPPARYASGMPRCKAERLACTVRPASVGSHSGKSQLQHRSSKPRKRCSGPCSVRIFASSGSAEVHHDREHHQHGHDHGELSGSHDEQDHHHDHDHRIVDSNPLHRFLKFVFGKTGLLQLADRLHDNWFTSAAITILFALGAAAHWAVLLGWAHGSAVQFLNAAHIVGIAGVYVLAGIPELVDLCFNITAGHIDTHVLMTLAVFGTLAIGGALEGALLLVLFQVSHMVEHKLTERATGDLRSLFDSIPQHAVLVDMGAGGVPDLSSPRAEKASEVPVGAHMLVKAGEQVALDGTVVYGEALVSTEHITGEALPVRRGLGVDVPAGALNHDGVLVVRATRLSDDSTPARIARLTAHAQSQRPQLRRWLDGFGEVYARCVVAATLLALVVLPLCGVPLLGGPGQRGAVYRAMGLLTTASPCALVLVPLAYVSAIAAVTSRGVLIKGGAVLDALAQCGTVAFDKTGTLTTGQMSCTAMMPLDSAEPQNGNGAAHSHSSGEGGWAEELVQDGSDADIRALATAVALSQRSGHPVSRAMMACGRSLGTSLPAIEVSEFRVEPGAGVRGLTAVGGRPRQLRFGSVEFATEGLPGAQAAAAQDVAARLAQERVVSLLVEDEPPSTSAPSEGRGEQAPGARVWVFTFDDTVHDRSAQAVRALQTGLWRPGGLLHRGGDPRNAVRVMMLTGDNQRSAGRVARLLGIEEVHADLAPEEKLHAVQRVQQGAEPAPPTTSASSPSSSSSSDPPSANPTGRRRGSGVIMVGDGINDAPALAAASVGMAVASTPTEAAASAADVILLSGDGVSAIPFLLAVADQLQVVVRQNLALAMGSIAVLALPTLAGFIPLWLAVALHEGSTLAVALNSLRLLTWRQQRPPGAPAAATLQPVAGRAAEQRQKENGSGNGGDEKAGAAEKVLEPGFA